MAKIPIPLELQLTNSLFRLKNEGYYNFRLIEQNEAVGVLADKGESVKVVPFIKTPETLNVFNKVLKDFKR